MSQTDSSIAPLRLFDDFLPYTFFIVTDETALSIFTTRVAMAIYPFYNPTLRDSSYLYIWAFIIFKAFPSFIQVIPSPPESYHLQLPIDRICRNYHISNTACFIFLKESPSQNNSTQSLTAVSSLISLNSSQPLYILLHFS